MALRTPALPSRYRDVRPAGRGGMADIYRATDTVLGRQVAIKVLAEHHSEDEDVHARFLREALAAARLSSGPHTVAIYDVGEFEGRPFIVMEYLAGGSLAEALHAGAVPPGQALEWLEQAARALDCAHANGVVHRDVKPANLLLDEDGAVRVADFGIASAAGLESHTQTGVVLGTAGYLAPEQAAGHRATAAADEYALAVVAHELLTGSRPGARPARLPAAAHSVFARALAARPEDRFESCLAFVAALRQALASGGGEAATAVLPGRRRRSRRLPALLAALIALGLLGAVLAMGMTNGGSAPPPPPSTRVIVKRVLVTVPASTPAHTQPVAAVAPPARGHHGKHGKDHKKHDHGG